MPRIKHVFDTDDDIRDLWIAGELDWARQRNGTASFRGPYFFRKLGGSAVRFAAPDGTVFFISENAWKVPEQWCHIRLYLNDRLLQAGRKMNLAWDRDALETIRSEMDKAIARQAEEAATGKKFSLAQAGRFGIIAGLHGMRTRLSGLYSLDWKPLMSQSSAEALASYVGRSAHALSQKRSHDQTAVWQNFRARQQDEANHPVDDETSIALWKSGDRLHVNSAVRDLPATYLRVFGDEVQLSHGPSWSYPDFNRVARVLIRTLREDLHWTRRALSLEIGTAARVRDLDADGVTFDCTNRAPPVPTPVSEFLRVLEVTAPRLAARLAQADAIRADRDRVAVEDAAAMRRFAP